MKIQDGVWRDNQLSDLTRTWRAEFLVSTIFFCQWGWMSERLFDLESYLLGVWATASFSKLHDKAYLYLVVLIFRVYYTIGIIFTLDKEKETASGGTPYVTDSRPL